MLPVSRLKLFVQERTSTSVAADGHTGADEQRRSAAMGTLDEVDAHGCSGLRGRLALVPIFPFVEGDEVIKAYIGTSGSTGPENRVSGKARIHSSIVCDGMSKQGCRLTAVRAGQVGKLYSSMDVLGPQPRPRRHL